MIFTVEKCNSMKLLAFALFLRLTSFYPFFYSENRSVKFELSRSSLCFECLIDGPENFKLWSTGEWIMSSFFVFAFWEFYFGYFIRWSCQLVNISSTYNCKSRWRFSIHLCWNYLKFVLSCTLAWACCKVYIVGAFGWIKIKSNQKIDIARVHVAESHFLTLWVDMAATRYEHSTLDGGTLKVMLLINTLSHSQIFRQISTVSGREIEKY